MFHGSLKYLFRVLKDQRVANDDKCIYLRCLSTLECAGEIWIRISHVERSQLQFKCSSCRFIFLAKAIAAPGAAESQRTPSFESLGTISFSNNSTRFALSTSTGSQFLSPVIFSPGCAKFLNVSRGNGINVGNNNDGNRFSCLLGSSDDYIIPRDNDVRLSVEQGPPRAPGYDPTYPRRSGSPIEHVLAVNVTKIL